MLGVIGTSVQKSKVAMMRYGAFILSFLILFTSAAYAKRLIFSIDLIRHGDRAPAKNIPGITDKVWDTNDIGLLTARGQERSEELGSYMKHYYVDQRKMLTPNFGPDSLYIASTDYERTIDTAGCFIRGMVGGTQALDFKVNVISRASSNPTITGTAKNARQLAQNIIHEIPEHKKKHFQDLMASVGHRLNVRINTFIDLMTLGDLLYVNRLHGIKYPENVLSKTISDEVIKAGVDLFYFRAENEKYMCAVSRNFVENVNNTFADKIKGKITRRKLYLYFAHDNTIVTAIALLGQLKNVYMPPYNSDLRFELYEEEGNYYVKTLFNGEVMLLCGTEYCSYNKFSMIVSESIQNKCLRKSTK